MALALAVALGGLGTAASHGGGSASVRPTILRDAGSGDCLFPVPASGVRGELTVDGGPLAPSAAGGVPLTYTYALAYRTIELPNGTVVASGCVAAEGNATTASNGSFSFVPAVPGSNCTEVGGTEACTVYSGAFVPVQVALADGPPAGYTVTVAGWSTPLAVSLVYELAGVTIAPGGPTVTTSVGAPAGFSATAWSANGSQSPLAVSFAWSVNGTGWSFDGPAAGASVALTAVAGSSVATLSVAADANVGGVPLPPVRASLSAVAISTTIASGETNRTVLDAGGAMEVALTASGAAGYRYSAAVEPGLGLPVVIVPCSPGTAIDGVLELSCMANVTYPSPGTAQPTANVTNGYSTADWRFPNILVNPPPELEVRPSAPVGYAQVPLALTVVAASGSGTPPYDRACLQVPGTPADCQLSPGPSWTFSAVFAQAGNYTASASAVDADGAAATLAFPVEVVPVLGLGAINASVENATVGATIDLRAVVAGGVLPLRYWWNASAVAGPLLDGELVADGALEVAVVPSSSGPLVVSLTVVDGLGTIAASELLLSVGPVAASRIAAVTGPPSGAVTVGVPVPLAWEALGAEGTPDLSFEAPADLRLVTAAGAPEAWVNASGIGPLGTLGDGEFGVPASAWVRGALDVNLTLATAANVSVELSGAGLPGVVPPMNLSVGPDRDHVRLYAPRVAYAGGRTNATFWHAEDRFGNPVPGALLTIGLAFGGERTDVVVAVVPLPHGGSGVWVNYSAPAPGAGTMMVSDAAGAVVLGPVPVPAAPSAAASDPTVEALAAAVPVGTVGAAAFAVVRRRRRAREVPPVEEELRRLAEGRARAVELIAEAGAIDLAGLEAAWGSPAPPALADWLASLVADGTVRATVGPDGHPRFCLVHGPADGPRVTVDPEVLDRSLRRRDEELGGADRREGEGPR